MYLLGGTSSVPIFCSMKKKGLDPFFREKLLIAYSSSEYFDPKNVDAVVIAPVNGLDCTLWGFRGTTSRLQKCRFVASATRSSPSYWGRVRVRAAT